MDGKKIEPDLEERSSGPEELIQTHDRIRHTLDEMKKADKRRRNLQGATSDYLTRQNEPRENYH